MLGGVFVTTTPVGWVIGSAAVMGAAGYGLLGIALAHGVANYSLNDHNGFDGRGAVMLRIKDGRFELQP